MPRCGIEPWPLASTKVPDPRRDALEMEFWRDCIPLHVNMETGQRALESKCGINAT